MTAKEYLGQAYHIDQRINSKLEQVSSLRELATKATSTLSDMPRNATPNTHSMENIICKIVDLENGINADIIALVDAKKDIMATVQCVSTTEYRTLLELRYICGKTWEEIAAEMSYSVRNIHNIHSGALREVGRLRAKI